MWVDEDFFDLDKHTKQVGVDVASGEDLTQVAAALYLDAHKGEPVTIALPPLPEGVAWEDHKEEWLKLFAGTFAVPKEILERRPGLGDTALSSHEKEEFYKELSEKIASGEIVLTRSWL